MSGQVRRRERRINVRISDEAMAALEARAAEMNVTPATLARRLILKREVPILRSADVRKISENGHALADAVAADDEKALLQIVEQLGATLQEMSR